MKKRVLIVFCCLFIFLIFCLTFINSFDSFHFTNDLFFGRTSNNKKISEEYSDIDNIYIDVDNAIVNLINNDSNFINVELYSERDNIKVKSYNNKLSIMSENRISCIFCTLNVINVYAPKDFKEYIKIINDYGHTNLDNFPFSTISITNRFGNLNVKKANVLNVTMGRGDINVLNSNNVSLKSNWGDVYINSVNNISIDSKFSNIEIKNLSNSVNMNLDFGNILIKKAVITEESVINNKYGDVDVEKLEDNNSYLQISEQFDD